MSVDEESTSCYCLLEAQRCHVLLEHPGRYALVGEPLNQEAAKRLRLAVFGSPDTSNPLGFTLRVYCVDDTPHAFQVWGKREDVEGTAERKSQRIVSRNTLHGSLVNSSAVWSKVVDRPQSLQQNSNMIWYKYIWYKKFKLQGFGRCSLVVLPGRIAQCFVFFWAPLKMFSNIATGTCLTTGRQKRDF